MAMSRKMDQRRLRNYLGSDESVEYTYQNYNVTGKRLIILKRGGFQDVAFHHITSLNYESRSRRWLIITGIMVIALGIIAWLLTDYIGETEIILILLGIILIILGLLLRVRGYLLHTSGGENFRIPGHGQQTETFLRIIREHMK